MKKKKRIVEACEVRKNRVGENRVRYWCKLCKERHKHGSTYETYPKDSTVIEYVGSHCLGKSHDVMIIVKPNIAYPKLYHEKRLKKVLNELSLIL